MRSLGAVFLQVTFQIEDQFLAHLTEPTILLRRHMGYRKEDTGLNTGKCSLMESGPFFPQCAWTHQAMQTAWAVLAALAVRAL